MSKAQEMQTVISISGVMSPELKRAVEKVQKELLGIDKSALAAAKSIGTNITNAAKTAAKAVGGLAAAGAGIAAGAFIKGGNDYIRTLNNISAQTGVTGQELKELEQITKEIYKSGKGKGFDDIAAALVSVKQASGLAGEELKKAANGAVLLNEVFEFDYAESTRAATALMKNFGLSSEEAYGIIAKGAQKGANKNGDLLDTLNEYSVHYKALGLNADQFINSLIEGAEAGSFSIDKVGDAIKEFTIRSKDGSKSSTEAFQALGLNASNMSQQFAAGGKAAEAAFFQTIKALDSIKDPLKKNQIGVALFGTQFEDLEAGVLKTFASMNKASGDSVEILREIERVKYDDVGFALTKIGRSIHLNLLDSMKSVGQTLYDQAPAIQDAANQITPILAEMGEGFAQALPGIIDGFKGALIVVKDFAGAIYDNWGIIKPILLGAGGIFAAAKVISFAKSVYDVTKALTLLSRGYGALYLAKAKDAIMTGQILALYAKDTIAMGIRTVKTWAFVAALKAQNLAISIGNGLTKTWSIISTAASIATRALGAAMAFLTSPIGIAVLAIAGLIAAGVWLYQNWDMVQKKAAEVGAWIAAKWGELMETLGNIMSFIGTTISNKWNEIKAACAEIVSGIVSAIFIKWTELKANLNLAMSAIVNSMREKWTNIKTTVSNLVGQLRDFVGNVWTSMIEGAGNLGNGIKDKIVGAFKAIPNIIKWYINSVSGLINRVIDSINGIGVTVPDWVPGMGGKSFSVNVPKIPMLAAGGFTNGVSIAGEAGREAVISFDPAYRRENIGYLNQAAALLGLERAQTPGLGYYTEKIGNLSNGAASLGGGSYSATYNLGGITFAPTVTIAGGSEKRENVIEQLKNYQGDLLDLIEQLLEAKAAGSYSAADVF